MHLLQALITGISEQTNVFGNRQRALFKHRKIVRFPVSLGCANNSARRLVNDHLRFYRVPFFLARIVSLLFFFGRSIGVSVTSTITNSKLFSLSRKAFLPGNFKSLQFLSRFSILTMVRAHGRFGQLPAFSEMELGRIFAPVFKRQQHLVCHRQFARSARLFLHTAQLGADKFANFSESVGFDTTISFETFRRKRFNLFKTHQIIDERKRFYCQITYARGLMIKNASQELKQMLD